MNTKEVKRRMKEKHITGEAMAKALGMNPATYYRKMQKNGEEFSALDINVFKQMLDMNSQEAVDFLIS